MFEGALTQYIAEKQHEVRHADPAAARRAVHERELSLLSASTSRHSSGSLARIRALFARRGDNTPAVPATGATVAAPQI